MASLRAQLALDALEMALWMRRDKAPVGLGHHSDCGVQYLSIKFTERLAEAEAVSSVEGWSSPPQPGFRCGTPPAALGLRRRPPAEFEAAYPSPTSDPPRPREIQISRVSAAPQRFNLARRQPSGRRTQPV